MPMLSSTSELKPEPIFDRYKVSLTKTFEPYVEDTWMMDEVCICDTEEDAEFICECLNTTEYDR